MLRCRGAPTASSWLRNNEMGAQMMTVRYVAVLFLITSLGHGQFPQEHEQVALSRQAEVTVRRFYKQLVSDPVEGIPTPKEMKVLSPYLSGSLIHRIEQAGACRDDWFRLHPRKDAKAPSTWTEIGLFSGADDRGFPWAFRIERLESKDNGSFRAYVHGLHRGLARINLPCSAPPEPA